MFDLDINYCYFNCQQMADDVKQIGDRGQIRNGGLYCTIDDNQQR